MTDHCWHSDNIVLTSNPPQYPETCCNCGGKRTRTSRPVPDPRHGPHAGQVVTYEPVIRGGDEPCVSR